MLKLTHVLIKNIKIVHLSKLFIVKYYEQIRTIISQILSQKPVILFLEAEVGRGGGVVHLP